MWLSSADVHCVFCFDLEFFGNIANSISECHVWEIGCVCMDTNDVFRVTIMPLLRHDMFKTYNDNETHTIVPPTFFSDTDAVSLTQAMHMWSEWMMNCAKATGKSSCLLVSHNCFKSDAPILQQEMGRINATFYLPTFFFDSLLFFRYALRGKRISDFSLRGLSSKFNTASNQSHRALSDALQLAQLIHTTHVPLSGIYECSNQLPLVIFDGIGVASANALYQAGVHTVTTLLEAVVSRYGGINELSCTEYLLDYNLPRVQDTAKSVVTFVKSAGMTHLLS